MSSDKEILQPCEVGYMNDHGHMNNHVHVRMRDLDRLAVLKAKAKQESGSFGFVTIMKMVLFVGIVCTFAVAFYRIACLSRDVEFLNQHVTAMQFEAYRGSVPTKTTYSQTNDNYRQQWRNAGGPSYDHHGFIPSTDGPCNCTEDVLRRRSRRSLSGSRTKHGHSRHVREVNNEIDTRIHEYGEHFAQHLLPNKTNSTIQRGNVFTWRLSEDETSRHFLKKAGLELVNNRFIRAPVSGLYFLYSQITFEDSLTRTVGHQMLAWGRCGDGPARLLMGSSVTQQRQEGAIGRRPRDSSYTGGVVYLSVGDYVGVRPELGLTTSLNVTQSDMNTFFGGFLISRDFKAPPIEEICN